MARLIGGSMVSAAGVDLLIWRLVGPASAGTYRAAPVLMAAFGLVLLFLIASQLKVERLWDPREVPRHARMRLWALWTLGCAFMPVVLAAPRMGYTTTFPVAGRAVISLGLIALGFVIATAKIRERG